MITKPCFERTSLSNALALIEVIREFEVAIPSEVARRFRERASNYDQTLQFLKTIKILTLDEVSIRLTVEFKLAKENDQVMKLIDQLFAYESMYRDEAFAYLLKFIVTKDGVRYKENSSTVSFESYVRNFLIDCGIIQRIAATGENQVCEKFLSLFSEARRNRNRVSPEKLNRKLVDNKKIGTSAEKIVVNFESKRLGRKYDHRIIHVSAINESAGFDIESVTVVSTGSVFPRFIEVKAVSYPDYKFYWSKAELQVARDLANWYWLYLVPVLSSNTPMESKIKLINDPATMVFENVANWRIETDVYSCSLRSP